MLNSESFFFLSAEEADKLFDNDNDRKASGANTQWWLRSIIKGVTTYSAGVVDEDGTLSGDYGGDGDFGARPAFNLDLSAVLLVSPAEGGKSGGATLAAIGTTDTKDWKLTLKDKDRGFADNGAAAPFTAQPGGTVSIPYKNAKTGTNEYVSVLLCDGTDAKYYGSVAVAAASGTATFTLPGDLTVGKTYTLKVFNEQKNGDKKSDYASDFVEYQLTVSEAPSPSPSPSPTPAADTTPTPTPDADTTPTPTPAADTTPIPGNSTAVPPVTQLPYMDDTDPDNGGQNNHSGKQWKFPKTGDSFPLGLWAGMIAFGALGLGALIWTNKRKK